MTRELTKYEQVSRSLADLKGYEKNSRLHSESQILSVVASIKRFGFTNPCLIDEENTIIAGHCRVEAAKRLRLNSVPCIVVAGLSQSERQALVIADNRLAELASWNNDHLIQELGELHEAGWDLGDIGFSPADMTALLHGAGPGDNGEDDGPGPVPVIPVTELGDVWLFAEGRHRLLCGDSTNPADVERVMKGQLADFCFTSPPYSQQRKYESGGISDWDKLMQGVFGILPTKPDAQLLVNLGLIHQDVEWVPYWTDWIEFMRAGGWRRFGWYVWDQGHGLQGDFRGRLAPSFEFIFHFNREIVKPHRTVAKKPESIKDTSDKKYKRYDDRTFDTTNYSPKSSLNTHKIPDSVIRVQRHSGGLGNSGAHPAVFPVDLVIEMLKAFSDVDDLVYEPFCGSGTSIIGSHKTGRNCAAIEISPGYVDVSCARFTKHTGMKPVLEATGESFDEVSARRPREPK